MLLVRILSSGRSDHGGRSILDHRTGPAVAAVVDLGPVLTPRAHESSAVARRTPLWSRRLVAVHLTTCQRIQDSNSTERTVNHGRADEKTPILSATCGRSLMRGIGLCGAGSRCGYLALRGHALQRQRRTTNVTAILFLSAREFLVPASSRARQGAPSTSIQFRGACIRVPPFSCPSVQLLESRPPFPSGRRPRRSRGRLHDRLRS